MNNCAFYPETLPQIQIENNFVYIRSKLIPSTSYLFALCMLNLVDLDVHCAGLPIPTKGVPIHLNYTKQNVI